MTALAVTPPATGRPALPKPPAWLAGLAPLGFVLALWWGVAAVGWFPRDILVPPATVAATFVELLLSGELPGHLAASFHRLGIGVAAALIAGLAYGCAAALSRAIEDYTAPTFTVLRTVPSIAFIPILILVFGIGDTFKIIVVAKSTFFPVALATLEAVRGIPVRFTDVARAYRLPRAYHVRRVILPACLPSVVTGIRLGVGRSWSVLVAAELVASETGLGQMMELGRQMFRLDIVMVGVVITGLIGFGLDRALRALEARLSRWKAN
jgi:sulfonate transport system permease protein